MASDERQFYTRRHVEKLVDGWNYTWERDETEVRPRWMYVPEEQPDKLPPDPHAMWAGMRSSLETSGSVDSEGAMIVMDLERSLHLLSRLHPDAAAVVSARVMCDLEDDEMDVAYPQVRGKNGRVVRPDWRRLRDRATAWIAAYLQGHPVTSPDPRTWTCEKAYRAAR